MTDQIPTFNFFVKCIHKEEDAFKKVYEEADVRERIAKLLYEMNYKFIIADNDYIKKTKR